MIFGFHVKHSHPQACTQTPMSDCPQESYGLPTHPAFIVSAKHLQGLLAPGTLGHVLRKPQGDRYPEKRFSHGNSQIYAEMNQATKLTGSEEKSVLQMPLLERTHRVAETCASKSSSMRRAVQLPRKIVS